MKAATVDRKFRLCILLLVIVAVLAATAWAENKRRSGAEIPADVRAVFNKPMYRKAIWGLRLVELKSGRAVIDLNAKQEFYIGSVRKIFSIGELLTDIGPEYRYNTPVFRRGDLDKAGVLHGDLVLVASGDLAMGGRMKADGSFAITNFDHNEADSLGNAQVPDADPLAGYKSLASQVAAAGVRKVTGDVIIDDRLFKPFNFRGEFDLKPIFVNDDVVDLTITPTTPGKTASVEIRPQSAALRVKNMLITGRPRTAYTLKLKPEFPQCIGQPGCTAEVTGQLPTDFVPPLTNMYPLVQTFRIVNPSNYARTVFIEALNAAGVSVDAAVAENPTQNLPPRDSYRSGTKLAELQGRPYSDYARLILKVSYNIGADTSLLLWGLRHGVDNMPDALRLEKQNLTSRFHIPEHQFHFFDGSGGGDTAATNHAVTSMLVAMSRMPVFQTYLNSLPILGVDGSLVFVTDFQSDPGLTGATGQVRAKTGTYVAGSKAGLLLKAQALGGYLAARSGRQFVFQLVVNNVEINGLADVLQVFQDQGRIAAILWRDN